MAEENQAGTITVGQAAKLLKVSDERVRQLAKMGYIARLGRGQFNLVNVVHGYIDYLKDDARRSSKTATASRMQDAKTAEIEMRIAEKRRELIPFEEATAAITLLAGKVRSELVGIAPRVTRDMTLRRQIESEVNGSLNRIAEQLRKLADALADGSDLAGSAGGDDA